MTRAATGSGNRNDDSNRNGSDNGKRRHGSCFSIWEKQYQSILRVCQEEGNAQGYRCLGAMGYTEYFKSQAIINWRCDYHRAADIAFDEVLRGVRGADRFGFEHKNEPNRTALHDSL